MANTAIQRRAEALKLACPYCKAPAGSLCVFVGEYAENHKGDPMEILHSARYPTTEHNKIFTQLINAGRW